MADELEANVEITFELIRDDGVRFARQGWRMYQHIYNRTIRTYLKVMHPRRPWQNRDFREAMLRATGTIRERVLAATGGRPVDQPTFKRIAIAVMREVTDAFAAAQSGAEKGARNDRDPFGPVCSDYIANPDDPSPE